MSQPPANPKIYHIVHVDKLASIIASGCLHCDAYMIANPAGTNIGMGAIKERRMGLPVTCYANATVGEFVPFYFCPRSVMLYVIYRANNPELAYRGGQDPIIHLEADLNSVLRRSARHSFAFTSSNAGAAYAQFWSDPEDLSNLDWDAIADNRWAAPAVKEAKQSEFLMYRRFSWQLFDRIGVKNLAMMHMVNSALRLADHKPTVDLRADWYY